MTRIAGVLLAAGRGTRFGGDKLEARLGGQPLLHHSAAALAALPLTWRFAVVAGDAAPPGYAAIRNPDGGQGRSLALAAGEARREGASAMLVVLGDMPLVSAAHLGRLVACHRGPDSLAASTDGDRRLPPALIGRDWFGRLERLDGDHGARDLLAHAVLVRASRHELLDVDTPADLDRAASRLAGTVPD